MLNRRFKLFFSHLASSLFVATCTAILVFVIWHPAPLAKAVGVTHIFLLMLAIDAMLGPTLTWVVAKEGKAMRLIRIDMIVIVLCQLVAIAYGLHSIAINRPVYMVFDKIRFDLVQASDVPESSLAKAQAPFNTLGWGSPKWIAVQPVKNDEERNQRLTMELQEGVSPSMQPDLYIDLNTQWADIHAESRVVSQLNQFNPPDSVAAVLQKYPQADTFLPLKAYEVDMTVLLDSKNKQVLGVVDLRPW